VAVLGWALELIRPTLGAGVEALIVDRRLTSGGRSAGFVRPGYVVRVDIGSSSSGRAYEVVGWAART